MDWGITLLIGILLGFIFAALRENTSESSRSTAQASNTEQPRGTISNIRYDNPLGHWGILNTGNIDPPTVPIQFPSNQAYGINRYNIEYRLGRINWGTRYGLRPQLRPISTNRQENTKALRENWRNSIISLIKLADKNMGFAKRYLETGNCVASIQTAATSVENISRALIYCYGEEPNSESGQEEILRMLSRRFQGNEKSEFEKAIDTIATIDRNRIAVDYALTQSMQNQIVNEANAKETFESATKVIRLFRKIITDNLAPEIPELGEACPKCRSLDVYVSGFSEDKANCTCNICQSKWTEPR